MIKCRLILAQSPYIILPHEGMQPYARELFARGLAGNGATLQAARAVFLGQECPCRWYPYQGYGNVFQGSAQREGIHDRQGATRISPGFTWC